MKINEKDVLKKLNANKEDITNFKSDVPTEQGTVEKNTYLVNQF